MSDTCTCPPSQFQFCASSGGVMISFPTCQIVPDGTRVENPYFDVLNNVSYFTYQLIDDCVGTNGNVIDLFLSICETIPLADILDVSQRLDGCPTFTSIPFDFNNTSGETPPDGYQYIRLDVNQDQIEGSSAVYRLSITGNVPAINISPEQDGYVVVLTERTLSLPALFVVGCTIIPRVNVTKTCEAVIMDNSVTLDYRVVISNPNSRDFDDVLYSDTITYNGTNVQIGQIIVNPPDINIDDTVPGTIVLSGDLGPLLSGESIEILYTISISAFLAPGIYSFCNNAIAFVDDIEGSAHCDVMVEVVSLSTDNCCTVNEDNTASFGLIVINNTNSPQTIADLEAIITIPENLIVEFTNFDICSATFVDDGTNVPLNMEVTNRSILLLCNGNLTPNSMMTFTIGFNIVSTSTFGTPQSINATITDVFLVSPDEQVLLPVTPLPNSNNIDISGSVACFTIRRGF